MPSLEDNTTQAGSHAIFQTVNINVVADDC